MKPLSTLLSSVPGSVTAAMMQKGRELKAAGKDVINLAGGEPDFDTPRHIQDAGIAAIRAGDTHYPTSHGTPELIEAIVGKLARENQVTMTPNQILVTPGAKWAIYAGLAAALDPGDEVLVLDPAWVSYAPMVILNQGVPIHVPLPGDENFRISEALLRSHITERTKLIMVTSPNNPTGRVLNQAEMAAIATVAREYDLYVLSDEIYEHILFDGARHVSLATLPGMAERTLIVNGFSKAYAMTGWRLGWLAAPSAITKLARSYQTQSLTSAASFTMAAGVAALNGPQEIVHAMTATYAGRRRMLIDAISEIPGIECAPPEGAFYLFVRFTHTRKNSLEVASALLEDALIATTPGSAFGAAGEGYIRFSFATATEDLEKTIERLAAFVPTLA